MMRYNLVIDEQFKRLIPPLSLDERKQLEENITQDGCRDPLCVWNNTILDGHNRYEICTRLGIPFTVAHIFLKRREEAVAWICTNQLGRRNISTESRRYLIGKRYESEKNTGAYNPSGVNQYGKNELRLKNVTEPLSIESIGRTKERLGSEYNISGVTVVRYSYYTKALDILTKVDPELTSQILSGKIKMKYDDVVALSFLSPLDIKRVLAQLSDDAEGAIRYIQSRQVMKPERHIMKAETVSPTVAIKEIPAYDPDASVGSLIFTIPSWISAIERTAIEADYGAITATAHINLKNALQKLIKTAQTMFDIMEETTHEQ